jgi:hypothetical protein
LLADEFEAAVEAFGEAVLHRGGGSGSFGGGKAGEVAFLLFVSGIAADPGEDLALFGEDRVDDVASQAEAAFVVAAVQRQGADSPLLHRLRGEAGVAADVARRAGRHGRDIDKEFLVDVERGQLADFRVVGFDERDVSIRRRAGQLVSAHRRRLSLLLGPRRAPLPTGEEADDRPRTWRQPPHASHTPSTGVVLGRIRIEPCRYQRDSRCV